MRLLKKLLPVATVASVACVVTPLVTSCGGTSITFSSDIDENGLVDKYELKMEPKAKDSMTQANAQKTYFEEVEKNKKILVDDAMGTFYSLIQWDSPILSIGDEKTTIDGHGKITISCSKFDADNAIASFKVNITAKLKKVFEYKDADFNTKITTDTTTKFSMNFKNVPVKFYYGVDEITELSTWFISTDSKKMSQDDDWKIIYKVEQKGKRVEEDKGGKTIEDIKQTMEETYDKDNASIGDMAFASFYYKNITCEDPVL